MHPSSRATIKLMAKTAKRISRKTVTKKPIVGAPVIAKVKNLKRWQIALLLPVLVFLAWGAYDRTADYFNARQFEQVQATIDNMISQTTETLDRQPNQVRTDKGCQRPNYKFGEGDLSCFYGQDLIFSKIPREAWPAMINKINSKISSMPTMIYKQASPENPLLSSQEESYLFTYSHKNGMRCSFVFTSELTQDIQEVSLSCSGGARSEYYPRID